MLIDSDTGQIMTGTVMAYDPETMTAVIRSNKTGGIYHDVVCLFDRYDPTNKAFSFKPPTPNAPCLYTVIYDTAYILGLYPAVNLTEEGGKFNSRYNNVINRTPPTMVHHILAPGDVLECNGMQSENFFNDTLKKLTMVPKKLYSVWDMVSLFWDNMCTKFRLLSAPMDVVCDVDKESGNCNTIIKFRNNISSRQEGTPGDIDIRAGNDANGGIIISVKNTPVISIDKENNVSILANNIKLVSNKKIEVAAQEITYTASKEMNMLNAAKVKLP